MEDKYFETSDLPLASFMKARNVDLREVRSIQISADNPYRKCMFVFRLERGDPYLTKLLEEWNQSQLGSEIRRALFACKLLKKAIKDHLTKHSNEKES